MVREKRAFWTLRYACINILYFAAFCTLHAYAAVYLLDKGFTNTQVGLVLSLANILSVFAQPLVAGLVDTGGKLTNRIVVMLCSALLLLGCMILAFVSDGFIIVFLVFLLMYMVQFVYQPIIIAMNFEYAAVGCKINFGLARGLGSAGFAVTSFFLGSAVERFGTNIILYVTIGVMICSILTAYFFKKPQIAGEESGLARIVSGNEDEELPDVEEGGRHKNFFARYPRFTLFLLGAACCFFAHNAINDYLIQIIRNVGGSETQMGYATFLQAILELPVMALISVVLKRISVRALLVFSAVAFTVKVALLLVASNMGGVYFSQSFQLFAYAVFIPAAAYFSDQSMRTSDKVKGQAYINSAITLGGVFSSLICGRILDRFGVAVMLITGTIVSLVGMGIITLGVLPKRERVPDEMRTGGDAHGAKNGS